MATKTVFQAGAVPQSTYDLGNYIKSYTGELQNLFTTPLAAAETSFQGSGVFGTKGTYATNTTTTGTDPYYQQASQYYTQLGAEGENLISQGKSEYSTGSSEITQGDYVYSEGVQNLRNITSEYPEIESELNQIPSYKAIMSTGLTPEQQAYVTQATQSQIASVTQQLQSEGLGNSTMLAEKVGAAKQAGAATAGQLIQGNIQDATAAANAMSNKVQERINQEQAQTALAKEQISAGTTQEAQGTSEQQLGLNTQATGDNYLANVAKANTDMQQQLYNEAIQGYGVVGKFIDETLTSYGLSVSVEQLKGSESGQSAQTSEQANASQQSSDASTFSSILKLFSSSGGSGGGSGGDSGGGSSSGSAIGGAVSLIGSAVGGLFCAVGQEVFGIQNPEWYVMRDVLLLRAPKWLRTLYIRHARGWARYLSTRPRLKKFVRTILRPILRSLSNVESGIFTFK